MPDVIRHPVLQLRFATLRTNGGLGAWILAPIFAGLTFLCRNDGWRHRIVVCASRRQTRFLKNQQLVEQRGISFERIVTAIEQGGLVNVLEHPNQGKYPGQMIYVVDIERYLYLVPFVTEADGPRFLKTIIPSRKATRDYHRRQSS